MKKFLIPALIICLISCAPKSYISKTYNFNNMKRIGVLPFNSPTPTFSGAENLFTKYLIKYGYTVVERAQLEQILEEQGLTENYLSPNVTRQIGKVLGVDVLLVGEITSYLPEQKTMLYRVTKNTSSTPVYNTQVSKGKDGAVKVHQTYGGQDFRQNKEVMATEHTIYAQVGVVAKMLDVNTAEVIWVGDDTQEGISGLDALDSSAKGIIKSFDKQVKKSQRKSL